MVQRTGCVSKLVLLALYPVLKGLGIAAGDLDLLLDRLLVHVGHAIEMLPDGGERGRERREAAMQADPGGRAGRSARTPGHGLGRRSAASSNGDGRAHTRQQLRALGEMRGGLQAWAGLEREKGCSGEGWQGVRYDERAGEELGLAERQADGWTSKGDPACRKFHNNGQTVERSNAGKFG